MTKPNHHRSTEEAVQTDMLEWPDSPLSVEGNPLEHKLKGSSEDRFFLDEDEDVIDGFNLFSGGQYRGSSPPSQALLRLFLLRRGLVDLVGDLIIKRDFFNYEADAIAHSLFAAIRASALNTVAPSRGIQFRFDGTLKRDKPQHLRDTTSLSLFCDDVECLLRDLYGDVDDDMLKDVLRAVRVIVRELTQFVRKELWQEHKNADDWDYYFSDDPPEEDCLSVRDEWIAEVAYQDLRIRARDVCANPSGHSKYTIQSAELFKKEDEREPEDVRRSRWEQQLQECERRGKDGIAGYDWLIAQARGELEYLSNKGDGRTDAKKLEDKTD